MPNASYVAHDTLLQSNFADTYSGVNIDFGAGPDNAVIGWAYTDEPSSTVRVNTLTIGGAAVTLGTDESRNTAFGIPGRMRPFKLVGSGLTGAQAVVATKTDLAGAATGSIGNIRIFWALFKDVSSVATEAATAFASGLSQSATVTSAAGQLAVWAAMSSVDGPSPPIALAGTGGTTARTPSVPTNRGILLEKPGAASSVTLNGTLTSAYGSSGTRGTVYSLVGTGGGSVAPTISQQPVPVAVAVGQNATFTSGATGTPSPTGKWQRNAVDIPGATSTSYTLVNAQLSDSGALFRYVATNGVAPDAISNAVALTVTSSTFSASFPLGVASDFTGAAKRTSQAWTGYVIPFNAASPAGAATAQRTAISGTTAADGALTITGIPFAGAMLARIFFGADSTLAAYTLTGTAA
jgi:hypothetical protein